MLLALLSRQTKNSHAGLFVWLGWSFMVRPLF
jgi:hypothetical protein